MFLKLISRSAPQLSRHYASAVHPDFLHKSSLPSYHFQGCLPRLPIPKLEDTMKRYVTSVESLEGHPSVSHGDLEDTKRTVHKFMMHEGPQLQNLLLDYDESNSHTSFVSEPWFDMYLRSRLPLPLNYNPFLVLNRDSNEALNDPVIRSTNMIISSLRFYKTLKAEVLKPEVYYTKDTAKSPMIQGLVKYLPNAFNLRYIPMFMNGAYPLDMSQYGNLMSATRIPQEGKDVLKTYPNSRHLVALRNGHFYTFNVLDRDGSILPAETIMQNVQFILNEKIPPPEYAISYLTTDERDTWARARQHLIETDNMSEIHAIDSAIFCLVFDDEHVEVDDPQRNTEIFLYGDGGSRWFDKSFSLIVTKNGESGINFEHSWGDGVGVVRYVNEMFEDSTKNPMVTAKSEYSGSANVHRLQFKLDDLSKANIEKAKKRYEGQVGRLQVAAGKYEQMNKGFLKDKKISPDGVMQLAIQVAHRRVYGHPAGTYESCSTAAFKHGRTETVRSCTVEAQAVAKLIAEKGIKQDPAYLSELNRLVRESCKKHNKLTVEAASGRGFDRHMFGIRFMAEKFGGDIPPIFKSPVWEVLNHIILSTSTLDAPSIGIGGFGPVVENGFGIGYGAREDSLGCNVTSYENRDVGKFVDGIMESFDNIRVILESS